jgi:2',3'-cyclic-nucleotide 2'-phosphodiesterase (5'-nucleotidase family)
MPRFALRTSLALTGAAALVISPVLTLPAAAVQTTIQIVGISDFHGRLEPIGTSGTPPLPLGGAAQLAGAVDQLRAANPNSVFASAGDNIGASTFVSNVQDDEPTIEALNAAGLQVSSVGNHEFDRGFADLAGRVEALADFPYLGANVYDAAGDPVLPEAAVINVGGIDVGFVGTVTPETSSLVNPAGIAGLTFGPIAEAANRVADELKASEEADVVVLLMHDGSVSTDCATVGTQTALQGLTGDIDAVIQGHTHTGYACSFTEPLAGGFTGPVVQSGEYGEALGLLQLVYDDVLDDVIASLSSAEVRPLVGFPTDPAVQAIVDEAVAFAEVAGAQELGEITADITRAFVPGTTPPTEDRGSESALGNFIADVQLDQTAALGAQIAFMNPGGLRDDFLVADQFGTEAPGVVTLGEANAVQPFANGVVTMTLTGAQIKQVLEEQWQPAGSSRPVLALGVSTGFFFTYDAARAAGDRIVSITLDCVPLDPSASYRVTVNSFLAAGGDNFVTLAQGTQRAELGVTDLEALIAYFEENSPITADTAPRRGAPSAAGPGCPAQPGVPGGQNPGLSVDTGEIGAARDGGAWAALVVGAVIAGIAGFGLRRRRVAG